MDGHEKKMNGNEKKMNGNETKMNGNECHMPSVCVCLKFSAPLNKTNASKRKENGWK